MASRSSSRRGSSVTVVDQDGAMTGSMAVRHTSEWAVLAGPDELGRSLLLTRGTATPSPWANAARMSLDSHALTDGATLQGVRRAFFSRSRVVYEVDPSLVTPGWGVEEGPIWERGVNFDFVAEAIWRLVRANSIDARDPENPVWPLRVIAVEAGAVPDESLQADVTLPDGRRAWCDGGPLHLWPTTKATFGDVVVVPRISLTRGLLVPISPQSPVAALAPDQLSAVSEPSVRARIIAPAGSGKTRVLVERARHLLAAGVPRDAVTLVAFNKRAQEEMRDRTRDIPGLRIQTLNAVALSILNGTKGFEGRGTIVRTIAEHDVRAILDQYVKFPRVANTDPAAAWIDALSQVRLGLESPTGVEAEYGGDIEGFADVFPLYRQHLAEHHLVDFDEQIYLAVEVLLRYPSARVSAERRGEILLVDEFQDLTPAHMLLLRLLAGPQLAIFAVGDDDQTIYGYSGASPVWLVQFEDHVPGAAHHALEINYRCPEPVVTAATNLLSRNVIRVPKEIRPGPSNVRESQSFVVTRIDDQVDTVLDHVRALMAGGSSAESIAVLSRVNVNLVPIRVALVAAGIPVDSRDDGSFVRNSAVASALAWFRLVVDPSHLSGGDIDMAARRPGRGISPKVRDWMGEQRSLEGLERVTKRVGAKDALKIQSFVDDLQCATAFAAAATSSSVIEHIRRVIGLDQALSTLDGSHQGRNSASVSDGLRSLADLARLHDDPTTFDGWLHRMLAIPFDEHGVTLATVHRVKGLEWPHVIVYDASAGVFPHRLSVDYDEERRVFHVAITRCTTSLLITADRGSPSMFLSELSQPFPSSRAGQRTSAPRDATYRTGQSRVPRTTSGPNPVPARVGMTFTWGGYDFTVRSVEVDGVVVTTGDSRPTTLPFGWTFTVDGEKKTLVAPTSRSTRAMDSFGEIDATLFDALKGWRREQAKADGVPAYVIFHDRTLEQICRVRPRTLDALLTISGIGPAKVDRYGDQILVVIDELNGD